ncbi:MAG: LysM peptidoglycan-binding domain-containing protein, partial [Deltaproteobacteria bacterium]|nr:LysM peptidoglycan-binding domain-containing protein [Deltaproteobacteria bacterium]
MGKRNRGISTGVIGGLVLILLAVSGMADADGGKTTYVVKHGDTLWGIAVRFYADPFLWPELWRQNGRMISNPDLIYPGQIIVFTSTSVPYRAGTVAARPLPRTTVQAPSGTMLPGPNPMAAFAAPARRMSVGAKAPEPRTGKVTSEGQAVLPSTAGGSGLISTRTPDVLSRSAWNASAFFNYTEHMAPAAYSGSYTAGFKRDWADASVSGVFNYGFLDGLEGGIVFPVDIIGGPRSQGGVQDIDVMGKYRFLSGDTAPISLAAALVIGIPSASRADVIGSGDTSVRVEADFGYRISADRKHMLYWDVGFQQGDYFDKAQPLKGYQSVPILLASLGYEYAVLFERAYLSVELVGQSADFVNYRPGKDEIIPLGDEDLYGLLGFRYLPTGATAVALGIGAGPPGALGTDTGY